MKNVFLLSVFFLLAYCCTGMAQDKSNKPAQIPPPGNIKMPEGYKHTRLQGIDSAVGRISNEDGLSIGYDIGRMAADYTHRYVIKPDDTLWGKEQTVQGEPLRIVRTKDGKIVACFLNKYVNFIALVETE
ncbi:MAG: hypothetical protein HKN33_10470 [Pyrinomonadaceae bacterium]|nr:hypothetical protein [Pyrinomonadaceae bacterium]